MFTMRMCAHMGLDSSEICVCDRVHTFAMAESDAKKARTGGTMLPELRKKIEDSLELLGEVEYHRKPHRKGPGPIAARCLAPEDLVHEKVETVRQGTAKRLHYRCSNPKCTDLIRGDKFETHVISMTSDYHLQELAERVLERSHNFAPSADWDNKEARMQRKSLIASCFHPACAAHSFAWPLP